MRQHDETLGLVEQAHALGFELCGVAPAAEFDELRRLPEWLSRGYAGEMKYLYDPRRGNPDSALEGARSVIVCALNYNTAIPYSTIQEQNGHFEEDVSERSPRGWISR